MTESSYPSSPFPTVQKHPEQRESLPQPPVQQRSNHTFPHRPSQNYFSHRRDPLYPDSPTRHSSLPPTPTELSKLGTPLALPSTLGASGAFADELTYTPKADPAPGLAPNTSNPTSRQSRSTTSTSRTSVASTDSESTHAASTVRADAVEQKSSRRVKKGPLPLLGAKSLRRGSTPATMGAIDDVSSGGEGAVYASADESFGEGEEETEDAEARRDMSREEGVPTLPSFDFAGTYSGFGASLDTSQRHRLLHLGDDGDQVSQHTRAPAILATAPQSPPRIDTNTFPGQPGMLSTGGNSTAMDNSPTSSSYSNSSSGNIMNDLDAQIQEAMANFAAYEAGASPPPLSREFDTALASRPENEVRSVRSAEELAPSIVLHNAEEETPEEEDDQIVESLDARRGEARAKALAFVADLKRVRSQMETAPPPIVAERGNRASSAEAFSNLEASLAGSGSTRSDSVTSLPASTVTQASSVTYQQHLSTSSSIVASDSTSILSQASVGQLSPALPASANSTSPHLAPNSPTPSFFEHYNRRRPLPACATHSQVSRIATSAGRAKAYATKLQGLSVEQSGLHVWLTLVARGTAKGK